MLPDLRSSAFICGLLLPALAEQPDLTGVEKRMAERPAEAFTIARRAADGLADQPEARQRLFRKAAEVMAKRLDALSEAHVVELADFYAKNARDPEQAARVRKDWLKLREQALGPADGPGRVQLARWHWQWLGDRIAAARLCVDALKAAPEQADAARMLRADLGYQLTESGWQPAIPAGAADREVRLGMTPAEVRKARGEPARVARQILYRRYLEQWVYDGARPLVVEFNCQRGQEPHVLTVHSPTGKP